MSDIITIRELRLRTVIGIGAEERRDRQDLVVHLVLYTDCAKAGASDDIADAVNYRTVTKQVIELVEGSEYYLVEKLATEIAKLCLAHNRVERVRVTVEKPQALRFAETVGVTIERSAADVT
ncbi:MAG: dihydroneopterin aldolase [Planctomycetota bacterium]|nr:dihydroneopterin aldolase [Planctomycetota bacterium]